MKRIQNSAPQETHPDFPDLLQCLLTGRINRRDFFHAAGRIGLSASAAAALATGLIGGNVLSASSAFADTPKNGGRIRVGTADSGPQDTIDPAKNETFTDILRDYFVYEKLTEIDNEGKLVPQLATSWTANNDATKWVFELREGVTFHNGKTLTSADVVHSINRMMRKDIASKGAVLLSDLKQVSADGKNRVVVELSSSNAELPYLMSIRWASVVPDGIENFPKDAIGTGAFKVKEFNPGLTSLFVRNENYWVEGRPYLDEIENTGIGDSAARLNALLSGEMDCIANLDPKAVKRVDESGVAKTLVATGGAHLTFPMKSDASPFNNIDVRTAMKHAFDRQKFIDLAFDGLGSIGRDNPIPPFDPFFDPEVPVPTRDPEKVKFLLKKAGLSDYEFELYTSDANYGGANTGIVLGELLKQTGVKVNVKKAPADSYWSAVFMKVPWCTSSWTVRPTAITRLEGGYVTNTPYNEAFWFNPKMDKLVADAKKELNEDKRKQLLFDAQRLVSAEGGTILPIFVPWIDAHSTKVRNLRPHPQMMLGQGLWSEVWLDS